MGKILITGGLGYIGSHTIVELYNNKYEVVIIDNLYNSKEEVHKTLETIVNKKISFYKGDVRDKELLRKIFKENNISGVIHFAGLKAVGESCEIPLEYYNNNIYSTLVLLEAMKEYNVKRIVFSSSATVYGLCKEVPLKETAPLDATNPYGRTKLYIEGILKDLYASDNSWEIAILRYFNPVGAHKSGLIGERPNGIPNNLVPYIAEVAAGIRPYVRVFGNDYDTKDGTGVRDYIHVSDLAYGHVLAIDKLSKVHGLLIYNLGTGNGYSVLDVIKAFEKASNLEIPYKICDRRPGDIAASYADPTKAYNELGFKAKYGIEEMMEDQWRFQEHIYIK
ncbi:UDP-glucose 4-epimerase GalE [bacterium]|nr:UDP-glucose 4-epimerase GalE [bacterium]